MKSTIRTDDGTEYHVDATQFGEPSWKLALAREVGAFVDQGVGRRLPYWARERLEAWAAGVLFDGADVAVEVVDP